MVWLISNRCSQVICQHLQAVAAWCVMRELCPSEGEVPGVYRPVRKSLVFVYNWHCTAADLLSMRHYLVVQLKLWKLARANINTPCHHST